MPKPAYPHEAKVKVCVIIRLIKFCSKEGKGIRAFCSMHQEGPSSQAIFGFLSRNPKWRTKYNEARACTIFEKRDSLTDEIFESDDLTADKARCIKLKLECLKGLASEGSRDNKKVIDKTNNDVTIQIPSY